jgi:CPA2 family monovalent cation:H+ antiporter-2
MSSLVVLASGGALDPMLTTLALGFTLAVVLGVLAHRLGLSPILGYLLAGIVVGPHTPGVRADPKLAEQLAEVGVVLLMFGVGLHFHLHDLLAVRKIAIPGAILQSTAATLLGMLVGHAFGWTWGEGLVLGMSIAVASTVVLLRVLMAREMLETPAGHVAVGWLVVEDLLTVLALVLLPAMAPALKGAAANVEALVGELGKALLLLGVLVAAVAFVGRRVIPPLLGLVARTRSRELFTLAVLAIALAVAAVAAVEFNASPALGAFLAGMVVAGSALRHQAAADALPLRDAFAVLFFVSAGMQFDPHSLVLDTALVLSVLGIVLVAKPLVAMLVVLLFGWSVRTALVAAIGLAQIGEFSFILGKMGRDLGVLPGAGASAIITAALISIALNAWLMGFVDPIERWLRSKPRLWDFLSRRAEKRARALAPVPAAQAAGGRRALIVGFGPTGQAAAASLEIRGIEPVIIDANVDTVQRLLGEGRRAFYGDARRAEVLESAGLKGAEVLLVTSAAPELAAQAIVTARNIDLDVKIIVRARYLSERDALLALGANAVTVDEEAVAGGLATLLLREPDSSERPHDEVDQESQSESPRP